MKEIFEWKNTDFMMKMKIKEEEGITLHVTGVIALVFLS